MKRLIDTIERLYEIDAIHIKRGFRVKTDGNKLVASNHLLEEAVELQAEVMVDNREAIVEEAGDLLTLIVHLLKRCDISFDEVIESAVEKCHRIYTTDPKNITAITPGVTRRGRI